jgi:molybdate/tungstate transport system substrate-binding protein
MNRLALIAASSAVLAFGVRVAGAQELTPLDVAYAGSMGSMMEGPIKTAAAQALQVALQGRAQGSDALAKLITGGSMTPDVFVPVTPGPMLTVLQAGKASHAVPVARTEMVIAYSPKSKYAPQFAGAAAGKRGAMPWWQILEQSDLRFGRTDPLTDPQGRNIVLTLQLAEAYYKQPGFAAKVLGPTINPAQIFSEPTVQARLQSGELDAASAYKIQPGPFNLPYVRLPDEINLGNGTLRDQYATASLDLSGKTYHPEPLVYYAAVLNDAAHKDKAQAFVAWLGAGAQPIFRQFFYDPPAGATPLGA